jgi:hypothetical protein
LLHDRITGDEAKALYDGVEAERKDEPIDLPDWRAHVPRH